MGKAKTIIKRVIDNRDKISKIDTKKIAGYFWYNKNWQYEGEVNEDMMLFESREGTDLQGNIFRLLRQATEEGWVPYLAVKEGYKKRIEERLKWYHLEDKVKTVRHGSLKYYKLLLEAKYLINDVTFPSNFIRRKEQQYINTWHGVPLKGMGMDSVEARMVMGNIMRNFMQSTMLVYANDYMMAKMHTGYKIHHLCNNTHEVTQMYPRDEIYIENRNRKSEDGIQRFGYLPTWREHNSGSIHKALEELDRHCPVNTEVIVKLHPKDDQQIDWGMYRHLKKMDTTREPNEVLSEMDGLITDYSSIMFDFGYARKPIVLYQYDKEEYEKYRGLNTSDLGLPTVKDAGRVFEELAKGALPSEGFTKKYCPETRDATRVLFRKIMELETAREYKGWTGIELLYAGNLNKNGITTSVINFANALKDEHNIFISAPQGKSKGNGYAIDKLDQHIKYYPMVQIPYTISGVFWRVLGVLKPDLAFKGLQKHMERNRDRYIRWYLPNVRIKNSIQYTGYEPDKILLYSLLPSERSHIFVHNDMVQESTKKGTVGAKMLSYAYSHYDRIHPVAKAILEPTSQFMEYGQQDRLKIIPNLIDEASIRQEQGKGINFDEDTECRLSEDEYKDFLNKHKYNFITIGRYSKEKRHDRLIRAFNQLKEKQASLTILGGYGEEYKNTIHEAEGNGDIVCIKSIRNPHSIMKACDIFILASDYEAQPLVLYEGYINDCKIMATDIPMNRAIIEQTGGVLVDITEDAIAQGMRDLMHSEKENKKMDIQKYNNEVMKTIEQEMDIYR